MNDLLGWLLFVVFPAALGYGLRWWEGWRVRRRRAKFLEAMIMMQVEMQQRQMAARRRMTLPAAPDYECDNIEGGMSPSLRAHLRRAGYGR